MRITVILGSLPNPTKHKPLLPPSLDDFPLSPFRNSLSLATLSLPSRDCLSLDRIDGPSLSDLSLAQRFLELLRIFSRSLRSLRFHRSLSSSSSPSPNLCYLISNPTFFSFVAQRLPTRSSWLRRDWRRFDFRICTSSSFPTVAKSRLKCSRKRITWRIGLRVLVTVHIGEMTVRETLAFSARVQGVGTSHVELLLELSRREKEANIKPGPDLDLFMKAAALDGQEASVITDYIIKFQHPIICRSNHFQVSITRTRKKRVLGLRWCCLGFLLFLIGTKWYRHYKPCGNPLTRVAQVFVAAGKKRKVSIPIDRDELYELEGSESAIKGSRKIYHSNNFRCWTRQQH